MSEQKVKSQAQEFVTPLQKSIEEYLNEPTVQSFETMKDSFNAALHVLEEEIIDYQDSDRYYQDEGYYEEGDDYEDDDSYRKGLVLPESGEYYDVKDDPYWS